jgi:hypothetical protein
MSVWAAVGIAAGGVMVGAGACYLWLAYYFGRNNPWG